MPSPSQGQISLAIHHDEDAEVYINGQLVKSLANYVTGYNNMTLSASATKALRKGTNTIAVHCHQTRGGQYIDAGLTLVLERDGN